MPFRKIHRNCSTECKVYTAYIRINRKLQKIGIYHSQCGQFKIVRADDEEARKLALIGLSLMKQS